MLKCSIVHIKCTVVDGYIRKIQKMKIGKMGQEGRQTVLTTAAEGCYKTIKKKNSITVDNISCSVCMKLKMGEYR